MQIDQLMENLPDAYNPADRDLILRAYKIAEAAHEGQKRASGEAYINHCVAVAGILAEMYVPPSVVAAGLLHDTVEDTSLTLDHLRRDFGDEIARLVDGVTKLTQLPRVSRADQKPEQEENDPGKASTDRRSIPDEDAEIDQMQRSRRYDLVSETLRKTFLAMGEDVRVILIKLADRLHNMRTLGYMPEHKRKRIAQETLDIFAPIANRLGIWRIKWELEDLGFRYTNPVKYKEIAHHLSEQRSSREAEMESIRVKLEQVLAHGGIQSEITARPKHIYSIYKKMERKQVPFDMVYDVRGVRIIVQDTPSCYSALGLIHASWRPIQGEIDDYIAAPKDNYYRSLHTAVLFEDGKFLEIQIRTQEMHQNAEYGIAAHWRYKEGAASDDDFEKRIMWLRAAMEWRQDVEDAHEFVDSLKSDVFQDRVYAFTPRGDIIDLPGGSTPIDFAYHVHTEIGHRCRGAKINGKLVSLDYQLQTGDKVEIIAAKRGGPSRDWLNPNLGVVKTQRARSKIRHWFKIQEREQNISQGRSFLERELRRLGFLDLNIDRLAKEFEYRNVDEFYFAVGTGDLALTRIVRHLTFEDQEEDVLLPTTKTPTTAGEGTDHVVVLGLKGLLTSMAKCCNPAPGDPIIGYITRGRGATIHRSDCPNMLRLVDKERLVRVSWGEHKDTYPVPVRIKAYDRNGLLKDVSTVISDEGINMQGVKVDIHKNLATFDLVLEVRDILQLSRVLDRLENLPNVTEVVRVRPG